MQWAPAQLWVVLAGASVCEMAAVGMLQRHFRAAAGVAGFSCPELGEVMRRGRYRGVSEIPWKEGVVVGCCPSHPLHQTRAIPLQAGSGAGKMLCLLFQQELLSHRPRIFKVTLLCEPTDVLVLQC